MSFFQAILIFAALAAAVGAAYYWPRIAVLGYIVFGTFPRMFSERFPEDFYDTSIGGGLNVVDLFLLGMVFAIAVKLIQNEYREKLKPIRIPAILFFGWLIVEVARNVSTFGLSAPGEFRYRYLLLIAPFYVAFMFDTDLKRRRLLPILTLFVMISIFLMTLYSGIVAGWNYGPDNRFMHSSVSLALAESFAAYVVLQKYFLIHKSQPLTWLFAFPVLLLIIIDSHRSVWLCIGVFAVSLFYFKELKPLKAFRYFLPMAALVFLASMVFDQNRINLTDYIVERGMAFVNYEDDPTSAWRVAVWINAFDVILQNPLTGIGFGGHWEAISVPGSSSSMEVFPHSIYIMTWVKLGLAGLVFYGWYVIRIWRIIREKLDIQPNAGAERGLLLLGLTALLMANTYGLVYGYEHFSWLWVGLALSIVIHKYEAPQKYAE